MVDSSSPTPATWWQRIRLRDVALGTITAILVVLGFALLIMLRNVLLAVFLGILLATALRPLMGRLRDGRLPRFLAASASVLLLLGVVAGFVVLMAPLLLSQVQSLYAQLPGMYADLRGRLVGSEFRLVRDFGLRLSPAPPLGAEPAPDQMLAGVMTWLPTVGYWLFVVLSTILFTYYWLLYRERSIRGLLLLLPMGRREGAETIWLTIEARIGAFLRGQLLLALITGVLSLLGYWLIGLPFALLMALIAAVLEFVPFLGPFIATGIATAAGLSVSPALGLSALVVGVIVQQIENIFLAPRIMDRAVGITPVVTLLAFVGFAGLLGPAGGLLAIPLAATGQVLFNAWLERRDAPDLVELEGRTRGDLLRYQARDLTQDLTSHLRVKEAEAVGPVDQAEEALEKVLADLESLLARSGGAK